MFKKVLVVVLVVLLGIGGLTLAVKCLWGSIWYWVIGVLSFIIIIASFVWVCLQAKQDEDDDRYH